MNVFLRLRRHTRVKSGLRRAVCGKSDDYCIYFSEVFSMNGITITLPDGVAASCVAYDGENYYACDGVRTVVYEFDASGQPAGCYNTVRPYKALRSDAYSGGFLALGGGCGRDIYYLDANMRETGAICPAGEGSARYVGIAVNGALLDVTYDHRIIRCTRSGGYIGTLNTSRGGTVFLGYDEYTEGNALAVEEDGRLYVAVDGETCTMPACTSFRGFLPFADKISLALGYRYLYTYIMPVAAEGNADFSAILGGIFGYNTGTGCCNIREKGV